MKYELMNNLSGALILLLVTVVFSMLFESKYPKKTYLKSLIPFISILLIVNFFVIFKYGFSSYAQFTFILATLPSLIYFYIVSKYKDGRFFYTFCLVDTMSIWFVIALGLTDYLIGAEGLLNTIIRVIATPIVIYVTYKYFRKAFKSLLHTVDKGWWLFTAATGIVYVMLLVAAGYPITIRQRPDDIPLLLVIIVFLPIVYATIFYVLFAQQKLHEVKSIENVFAIQKSMIESRVEEIHQSEEKIKIERHDIRHKLRIIEELALKNENEQILDYLGSITKTLDETTIDHYCVNPILDAILSSYFRKAKENNIKLETHLSIPDKISVSPEELATLFANIIENAIHANCKLPKNQRYISCTCINNPTLMLEVKNPYIGKINFGENGLPISDNDEHGIGTKSISAFCKKYNAEYYCLVKDGTFIIRIGL